MRMGGITGACGLAVVLLVAGLCVTPTAAARVRIGIGIAVPGVAVGVGNCWGCVYRGPPAYYRPVYAAPVPVYPAPPPVYPVVYPAPLAVYPAPVHYGYGYYGPRVYHPYYRRGYRYHHRPMRYRGHRYYQH